MLYYLTVHNWDSNELNGVDSTEMRKSIPFFLGWTTMFVDSERQLLLILHVKSRNWIWIRGKRSSNHVQLSWPRLSLVGAAQSYGHLSGSF